MNKPKPLTLAELNRGLLLTWTASYSTWLSNLPSFQNGNSKATVGRVKAARSLFKMLRTMLPEADWTKDQVHGITCDIIQEAKMKANSY